MSRLFGLAILILSAAVMLAACGGEEAESSAAAYYPNCAAVRAAGAAPIYEGDSGYSSDLDRDGDGVACEN